MRLFYQNYLELSFSISTEFGAESVPSQYLVDPTVDPVAS